MPLFFDHDNDYDDDKDDYVSAGDWRCLCSAGWDGDDCSTRLETNCADGVDNDGGAFLLVLLVVLVLVVLLRCCFLNSC